MANHDVTFKLPEQSLSRVDVEFTVYKGSEPLGTLKLSKGGAEWLRVRARKGKRISWTKLSELIEGA